MAFYGASQKITPQQRAQANIKSAQAVQAYNASQSRAAAGPAAPGAQGATPMGASAPQPGQQLGMMSQGAGQQATAQAAQSLLAPSPPPPAQMPSPAASMQSNQATAQAAQQLLAQPQQHSLYQGMVDQGAQMAGSMAGLQQAGDQMAGQQNQMQRQADLMRAAQMRGTRTPAAAMGQMGAIQNSAAAQNPYASMLQSAQDSYKSRGWGIDPSSGTFVHPPAGQADSAANDWGKAMQTQQNQNMGSLPGWAQSQVRGGSAAPSWGGHW